MLLSGWKNIKINLAMCIRTAFILVISLVATSAAAEPTILTGQVTHVRDGDTIEVGKIPIRLNGVSAPELKEPFGPKSKRFMRDLVLGKRVRCELNGKKTYDRLVGVCFLGGRDIGLAIIKAGLALDCPRFSGGRYARNETPAARTAIKLPRYCG
jgi:micrococcal nuclease